MVRTKSYSRLFTILATMVVVVLVLVGGVAFAVTRNCQSSHKCVDTHRSDTLPGTSNPDRMYGLKGRRSPTGNRVVFSSSNGSPGRLTINLVSDSGALSEVTDELGSNTLNWDGDVIDRVLNSHITHDIITGNDRANEIISRNGNDNISGGDGDDYIDVQDGLSGDTVDCGDGNDTVFFDSGDTVLNCENQNS